MLPKTPKMMLLGALEDLTTENFDRFRHQLLDRRAEPRVRRNKVEGKTRLEIADVLVSHFTEAGALQVAVETLTEIGCNEEAQTLAREAAGGH